MSCFDHMGLTWTVGACASAVACSVHPVDLVAFQTTCFLGGICFVLFFLKKGKVQKENNKSFYFSHYPFSHPPLSTATEFFSSVVKDK